MTHSKPAYARFDPAHVFDGLFVPTKGKKRDRLYVKGRRFGKLEISFQGFEQLGADDQSILLAISAQLGIEGLVVSKAPKTDVGQQLRLKLEIENDDGADLAAKRTTYSSLMIDAGYAAGQSTDLVTRSLNRLSNAQIREINKETGSDRRSNLIATSFNHKTKEIHVVANPRLTSAVFNGQHIKVSLFERNMLETEVAKLLHCWLCSNIRLGEALGRGNGAKIDTLAPHVWGLAWEGFDRRDKSKKRSLLRDALWEIDDKTKQLCRGNGWAIDQTSSGLVIVSRPKTMPFIEDMGSPSEIAEACDGDTYEHEA